MHIMNLRKPSDFQPALADDRLAVVAAWLMEEWAATEDDLVRETDSPYTRGTTCFGRQRTRILNEYLGGRQAGLARHRKQRERSGLLNRWRALSLQQ